MTDSWFGGIRFKHLMASLASRRGYAYAINSLVWAALLYMLFRTDADPDLWGHVRFGQDVWQSGRLIMADPYSYTTAGQPWINHEWLAELLFYLVFAAGGVFGLIALRLSMLLAVAGLTYRHLASQKVDAVRLGMLVILAFVLCQGGFVTIRPQLFTWLFFCLLLLAIAAAERGRLRVLWVVPPMFILWTNAHGGFLAGMGFLLLWAGLYCINVVITTRRPAALLAAPHRTVPLVALASLCAIFVNPYGYQLLTFLLRTATGSRLDISEWNPLPIAEPRGLLYLLLVVITWAGVLYSRRPRTFARVALLFVATVAPLVALRHVPLFALTAMVLGGEHVFDAWDRWSPRSTEVATASGSRLKPIAAGVAVTGALVLLLSSLPQLRCIRLDPVFPVRAVSVLKQSGVSGNLALDFDWGEYALWYLSPGIKISMDGRRETVYSDKVYQQNLDLMFARGNWDAMLRDYDTHLVLAPKIRPVFNLMKLYPGWELAYEDSISAIFARRGSSQADAIRRITPSYVPVDGTGMCFP